MGSGKSGLSGSGSGKANAAGIKNNTLSANKESVVSFDSNAANSIMDIPVEKRSTRANPRTQAALQKSESLTNLQNALNDAPVGTAFGFTRKNGDVEIYEKVNYNFGHQQGWTKTTLHSGNGGVSYGGGIPKSANSVDFVSTINMIKGISDPISQADMGRYKRFRQKTDLNNL